MASSGSPFIVPSIALAKGAPVEVLQCQQWKQGKIVQLNPMLVDVQGEHLSLRDDEWRCILHKDQPVWVWWGGDYMWYPAWVKSIAADHVIVNYKDGSSAYLEQLKENLKPHCMKLKRSAAGWSLLPPDPDWDPTKVQDQEDSDAEFSVSRVVDVDGTQVKVEWEGGDLTWEPFRTMFDDVPELCQRDLPEIFARKLVEDPTFIIERNFRSKLNLQNLTSSLKKLNKTSETLGQETLRPNTGSPKTLESSIIVPSKPVITAAEKSEAESALRAGDITPIAKKPGALKQTSILSMVKAAPKPEAVKIPNSVSKCEKLDPSPASATKPVPSLKPTPSSSSAKSSAFSTSSEKSAPSPAAATKPSVVKRKVKEEDSFSDSSSDSSASSSSDSSDSSDADSSEEEEEEKKVSVKRNVKKAKVVPTAEKQDQDDKHKRTRIGIKEVDEFFAQYPKHPLAMLCPFCSKEVSATGSQKPFYEHFRKCISKDNQKADKNGQMLFKCPTCQGPHQAFFPPFMVHLSKHWSNSRHIAECPMKSCTYGSANMKKLVEHWTALCPIRFGNIERKAQSHVLGKDEIGTLLATRNKELARIKSEALPALPDEIPKPFLGSTTIESNSIAEALAKKIGLSSLQDAIKQRFLTPIPEDVTPQKMAIVLVLGRSGSGKSMMLRQLAKNSGIKFEPGSEVCMAQPGWHLNRCIVSHFPQDVLEGPPAGKSKSKAVLEEGGLANKAHLYLMGIGLNSIPAWTLPYKSLSQGERYRADLARMICRAEQDPEQYAFSWKIVDEFTSCLDRTTARSVATSLGRMLRERKQSGWVVASANADIVPWLQPDVVIALDDDGRPYFCYNPNKGITRPDVRVRLNLDQCAGLIGNDEEVKSKKDANSHNSKLIYSKLLTYDSIFGGTAAESEADRWRGLRIANKTQVADYPLPDELNQDEIQALSKALANKRAQDIDVIKAAKKKKITTHIDCTVVRDRAYLEAAKVFDAQLQEKTVVGMPRLNEHVRFSDEKPFGLLMIIGPSGSGKTSLAAAMFPGAFFQSRVEYLPNRSIVSYFQSAEEAEERLGVVGLGLEDALRPYDMLSRGQQHRADIARLLAYESVIFDEFTSYLDRGSAIELAQRLNQYWARKKPKQVVLLACHDDLIGSDRIQPDYVYETEKHLLTAFKVNGTPLAFDPNSKRYRVTQQAADEKGQLKFGFEPPKIRARLHQCKREGLWEIFSRHHYKDPSLRGSPHYLLTMEEDSDLHGDVVGFLSLNIHWGKFGDDAMRKGYLKMYGEHRVVVLPKYQSLGLGGAFSLAVAYVAQQRRWLYKSKTAHRRFGEARDRSPFWEPMGDCGKLQARPESSSGVLVKHVLNFIPRVYFQHKTRLPLSRDTKEFRLLMKLLEVEKDVTECFAKSELYTGSNYSHELKEFEKKRAVAGKRKKNEEEDD